MCMHSVYIYRHLCGASMTRAGHGAIYRAVSGRVTTAFGRRRKRGLYHQHTNELFKPKWGPVKRAHLLEDMDLPKWCDGTLDVKDKLPPQNRYDKEARLAWRVERPEYVSSMYRKNEVRYFKPALMANNDEIRHCIFNALEPGFNSTSSAIGMGFKPHNSCKHIADIVSSENASSSPAIDLHHGYLQCSRVQKLQELLRESDSWRQMSHVHESCTNPFPHVNEGASLIRNLTLADILHVKSNHRLKRKAQPKWYAAKYRKFLQWKRLKEKQTQLQLEEAV